ncbi:hypothetical protein [Nocardioides sp. WS12]|uniref:hypothetical protein n=1 Tax=Nocardioides sp. WS12 TaxID=2486272 RepID=UPI00191ED712|nr:hypothetical protein [Nocardioides sp. WS12]
MTEVLQGSNPFGVDPDDDLLHAVPDGVPGWSETMYFHVWSPDTAQGQGVGVFIHCGRWPEDPDLWWAQVIALLPDGRLLVDRSWGRAPDDRGPATGNLRIRCVEPLRRWRLELDGAGEITSLDAMVDGPVGAGPAQAFTFAIDLEAAAPVWDMHAALGIDGLQWAAFHHTQGFRATGSITAGSGAAAREWDVAGVAHRDHSSGPRDVSHLGGLHFCVFVFPQSGRVINGLVNWNTDHAVDHRTQAVFEGGTGPDATVEIGASIRFTGLEDHRTHQPRALNVAFDRADGSSYDLKAEWLHGYSLTFLSPNENINGVDLDGQPDALVVTQSTVRVVAPDGEVGYGVIERDYRPSHLPSPQER